MFPSLTRTTVIACAPWRPPRSPLRELRVFYREAADSGRAVLLSISI
ncbi:hypothetical protein [Actinoplanes regularis]|nr:hypothetical protein [Actinoplanes regularis]